MKKLILTAIACLILSPMSLNAIDMPYAESLVRTISHIDEDKGMDGDYLIIDRLGVMIVALCDAPDDELEKILKFLSTTESIDHFLVSDYIMFPDEYAIAIKNESRSLGEQPIKLPEIKFSSFSTIEYPSLIRDHKRSLYSVIQAAKARVEHRIKQKQQGEK